mgnify:CR=1 FL=1
MHQQLEGRLPLVAILRGLEPTRAVEVAEAVVAAGFDILEVPLNSPEPFVSIAAIVEALGRRALVGAGTVLKVEEVDELDAIGARLVVSPNCNPPVIARSARHGMVSLPGVVTPSEMFTALDAGASGLKIFPAELFAPSAVKAVRAVLPASEPIYMVGGIHAGNMGEYLAAGAAGFGMGSALFKPGKSIAEISRDAAAIVAAFRAAEAG